MCDPITLGAIAAVASTGLSVVGGGITAKENIKANSREADARNRVLQETLRKNDALAANNQNVLHKRLTESAPQATQDQLQQTQQQQTQSLTSNLDTTAAEVPLAGNAPQVVKSAMGKAFEDSLKRSTEQAAASGKLGAYTTQARDNAIADGEAGGHIDTNNAMVRGNLSILPYRQDYASIMARKPGMGLGQVISAASGALAQAGGAYAAKKPPIHPLYG